MLGNFLPTLGKKNVSFQSKLQTHENGILNRCPTVTRIETYQKKCMLRLLPHMKQCLILLNHILIAILLKHLSHLPRRLALLLHKILQVLKYTLGEKKKNIKDA